MNKKTITIILSAIIIAAFFLPYISNEVISLTGYNIVFGKGDIQGIGGKGGASLYINLLVPGSALIILIGALLDDSFADGTFFRLLPLLGMIYIVIMLYVTGSSQLTVSELVGWLGYGFWISLVAAVALPFTK
ncbi:MAG: hypothetical protein IPH18_10635 [Chitinophagaceae bacterium]|nr:hypothetical protein [Chitinophagaceae bacterium]MBK8952000.1 hypothetical protein [Chitinophagaceae bacterium]